MVGWMGSAASYPVRHMGVTEHRNYCVNVKGGGSVCTISIAQLVYKDGNKKNKSDDCLLNACWVLRSTLSAYIAF